MKANILLEDVAANRDRWLELRKGKISASIIPAVVGQSRWKSRLELWAEFTGKVQPSNDDNDYMALGRAMEPYIGQLFSRRTGKAVKSCDRLYQHPSIGWAIASPDFEVFEAVAGEEKLEGLLEAKNTSHNNAHLWNDESCPGEAHIQLIWQLGVTGIDRGWVGGLVGGDPRNFFYPIFEAIPSVFLQLVEQAERFLEFVKQDIPPDPGPGDSRLIEKIIGDRSGSAELTEDRADRVFDLLLQLRDKKLERTSAEKVFKGFDAETKRLENQIKLLMGDNETVLLDNGTPDGIRLTVKNTSVMPFQNPGYSYSKLYIKGLKNE